jgi:hypothetical protein
MEIGNMPKRALMLLLVLAGCAGSGAGMEERERSRLERQLAGRVAGEPRRCITRFQGTALTAVDRSTVVYDAPGALWVNRLRGDCPGLRPDDALIVESHGDEYCANDRIRPVERGSNIPGAVCFLGEFTPYRRAGR